MNHAVRMGRRIAAAIALLCLMAPAAMAGPIVSVGPYDVTLQHGDHYQVSGAVYFDSNSYHYEYTVQNLNTHKRNFELALASNQFFWGNYTETNGQVSPGTG